MSLGVTEHSRACIMSYFGEIGIIVVQEAYRTKNMLQVEVQSVSSLRAAAKYNLKFTQLVTRKFHTRYSSERSLSAVDLPVLYALLRANVIKWNLLLSLERSSR